MSILSVDKVTRTSQIKIVPTPFRGCIDSPKAGESFDEYALTVSGWALINNSVPQSIDIFLEGKPVRTVTPRVLRPDISARFGGSKAGEKCGFRFMIGALGTSLQWTMRLEAVAASGERFVIGTINGRRAPVSPAPPDYLQALFVTSLGRSGSTYLMRLMSSHPEIVALGKYPYESRSAQFHLHQARINCEPVNEDQSAQRSQFWVSPWWTGNNPFYAPLETTLPELKHWFGKTHIDSSLKFCHQNTEAFYQLVAQSQNQPKAKFFLEKTIGDHPWIFWEIYPQMREIFLIRDFRDTICSILAFNAKRGNPGFGREKAGSDKEYILQLGPQIKGLHAHWKKRSNRAHLLRYEDLVEQPMATLQKVFKYLDLPVDEFAIQEILDKANQDTYELKNHRTTSAPQSSVGRWENDLSPELQDACRESFGDILPYFGYA